VRVTLVTPPAAEPVSLAEAKAHLRVEIDDDDALITGLVVAARQACEHEVDRAFVTQVFDYTADEFGAAILLPIGSVQSVGLVTYVDDSGATATLAGGQYLVSLGAPGLITPAYNVTWPVPRYQPGAVTVRFTAGYGAAAAVPECAKLAIKMLVAHWYENRAAAAEATVGGGVVEMPLAVKHLLAPLRWGSYS
jgi:uncharacterized phiE125 gp8 family phage protein